MLIEMSPSISPHGEALFGASAAILPKGCKDSTDVAFTLSDTLVLAPDIAIISRDMVGTDADGAGMLLVTEIADSSLEHDLYTKAPHYAREGVRDYWIIDLPKRKLHVHRDPGATEYGGIERFDWNTAIAPLFDSRLVLTLSGILDG